MERITYNGKQLWPKVKQQQPRRLDGRYQRGSTTNKVLATIFVIVIALVGSYFLFAGYAEKMTDRLIYWIADQIAPPAHAENKIDVKSLASTLVGRKVDDLKEEVVSDIERCESGGDYGILVFDSNNEASVGGMQFQRKTVQHYVQKFEGRAISKQESVALAIDNDAARGLAKRIIFDEKDGWKNWYNCGVKVNAAARVSAINSLTI